MRRLWVIAICAVVVAGLASGIYYYRHRYVRSDEALLALLPGGDVTTFYADIAALRASGLSSILTGTSVGRDKEYEKFVRQVNFDYSRDLDKFAAVTDGRQVFAALQGRFDWEKLRRYPADHGGSCVKHVCRVPSATPGRWVSFHLVQPDVLAVALSADMEAVNEIQPPAKPRPVTLPSEPVWVQVSKQLLNSPGDLPLPLRIFAISVQSADPVVLSAGPAAEGSGAAFRVHLDAACQNESAAETIRNQLEIQTRMLQLELKREGQKPNLADLTGLLTSGSFQIVNKHVIGSWPVRFELLRALQ